MASRFLSEPLMAFYHDEATARGQKEFQCEAHVAWKTRHPDTVGFAFPKHSPYLEVMRYQILKLYESGVIRVRENQFVTKNKRK